ncbi:MAG: lipase family protein [Rhodothermales bacterium]
MSMLLVFAGAGDEPRRGTIVSVERIASVTVDDVAARLREAGVPGRPMYGVTLYRVLYRTTDTDGALTVASGALAVPEGLTAPAPLLSYQHGTTIAKDRVASMRDFDLIGMGFGASGYITALPDYLGLGVSDGLHPYVHAASLSTAIVDMLRAVRQYSADEGVLLGDQLFLMGYSEGGYATMAAHRAIEAQYADEFEVTASAPMAGPYSLSDVMFGQMVDDRSYPTTVYLPLTLFAYDQVYDLFENPSEVLAPPYDTTLPALFDGALDWREINAHLPDVPRAMLSASFLENLAQDPAHPLLRALRENDVFDWKPRAPMKLFHCLEDEQVPFRNAEMAIEAFHRHGAVDVDVAALDFGGHEACAPPAIFLGKLWFDAFVDEEAVLLRQARATLEK